MASAAFLAFSMQALRAIPVHPAASAVRPRCYPRWRPNARAPSAASLASLDGTARASVSGCPLCSIARGNHNHERGCARTPRCGAPVSLAVATGGRREHAATCRGPRTARVAERTAGERSGLCSAPASASRGMNERTNPNDRCCRDRLLRCVGTHAALGPVPRRLPHAWPSSRAFGAHAERRRSAFQIGS